MQARLVFCFLIMVEIENLSKVFGSLEMNILKKIGDENSTVLSRQRRYLVFPEGSSFQVVFDLTYPSVGLGNVFVFGNTAAMGFELPSTPIFLDKKKMSKEEEPENKTMEGVPEHLEHPVDHPDDSPPWQNPLTSHDMPEDYEEPEDWQHKEDLAPNPDSSHESTWNNIDRSPVTFYSNPFEGYVNRKLPQKFTSVHRGYPKFYGDAYGSPSDFWNLERNSQSNRKQAPISLEPIAFDNDMSPFRKTVTHHIHRRSRRELYTKIEKLLTALSKDGKACILKAICQVNKIPKNKGSMWDEILKAIFKVKPHDFYPDEDHYDKAANSSHDCDKMYPQCDGHVLSKIFRKKF